VQSGRFVDRLMAEYDAGFPNLLAERAKLADHPMEQVQRELEAIAAKAKP